MITKETIQRIIDTAQIEEVIGEFVSLKKRGSNHIGCCPFHNEKTPSFHVSASKGIYKCFGCGEAGDVVKFLMKHEHFSYPEALRWLADKYNIPIEEEQLSEKQQEQRDERDALFHVSDFAQKYFQNLLFNDEMGKAIGLSYFHARGLTDEVIRRFGLGYCLDEWSDFSTRAKRSGYSEKSLVDTGLSVLKDNGSLYDRFRGRVMFPIYSISGRVLGFSGRILKNDKNLPKYVNSPDSVIYNKGNVLYGIFQAKNSIGRLNKCYLVEGNVDVVSMHLSGVENTVASCGTALTKGQIALIKRFTSNVTVLYDGDSAGIKASLKAINLLFEEGMRVRVVLFPDGEDPDSYARKHGSEKLIQYLRTNEENFVEFMIRVLLAGVEHDPIKRAEVQRDIINTIALVPDMLERNEYVKLCTSRLKMSEQTIHHELVKVMQRNHQKSAVACSRDSKDAESGQVINHSSLQSSSDVVKTDSSEISDVASPVSTQADVSISDNPAEYQERKLISLLLNHGNRYCPGANVEGKNDSEHSKFRIANMIVDSLTEWDCAFINPLCQHIFLLYKSCIEAEIPFPDYRFFLSYGYPDVKDFALSLLMETEYKISDTWVAKNVYTPSLESKLFQDISESILAYKMKMLNIKITENAMRISQAQSDEEIDMYLSEKVELDMLKKELGNRLNRVIS